MLMQLWSDMEGQRRNVGFCFPKSTRSSRGRGESLRKPNDVNKLSKEACFFELLATVAGQLLQEQEAGFARGASVDPVKDKGGSCLERDTVSNQPMNMLLGSAKGHVAVSPRKVKEKLEVGTIEGDSFHCQHKEICSLKETQLNRVKPCTTSQPLSSKRLKKCEGYGKEDFESVASDEKNLETDKRDGCETEVKVEQDDTPMSELVQPDAVIKAALLTTKLDCRFTDIKRTSIGIKHHQLEHLSPSLTTQHEDKNLLLQEEMIVDDDPALVSSSSSEEAPFTMAHKSFEGSGARKDTYCLPKREDDGNSSESTVVKAVSTTKPSRLLKTKVSKARKSALSSNRAKTHQGPGSKRKCQDLEEKTIRPEPPLLINSGVVSECSPSAAKHQTVQGSNLSFSPCVLTTSPKSSTRGSGDSHVKLNIKSFTIPELLVEVPESATVATLKKAVMESAMNLLGDGFCVRVLLQGKRVTDETASLLQTGLSSSENPDALSFMLEPSIMPACTNAEESQFLLSRAHNQPASWYPVLSKGSQINSSHVQAGETEGAVEIDANSSETEMQSPTVKPSHIVTVHDTSALILHPGHGEALQELAVVPLGQKPGEMGISKRRMRRPFSVAEVEALVQAVEKLGTGRWRDVKLHAFSQSKHRTYVDLKDKWKTLVHTASIAPHQRRGEPVPQGLLDRVIQAHSYWTANTMGQAVAPGN